MYYISYLIIRLFASFVVSLFYTFFSFLVMYAISYIKKDKEILNDFGNIWGELYIVNMIMFFLIIIFFQIEI